MYKEQIITLLDSLGQYYQIKGNEIVTKCLNPEHQDRNPSYSINYITGQTYCFSCGFKDPVPKLLGIPQDEDTLRTSKYLALSRQWEEDEVSQVYEITLPPVDFYIDESIRGISREILKDLGVYYCSHGRYKGRLVFPIRDAYGNLLGFDARIHTEDVVLPNAKYLRPTSMRTKDCLYPLDYLYKNSGTLDMSRIVLVEGVFDALSYIQMGVPALANFGLSTPSPEKIGRLISLGCDELCLGLDKDTAGIASTATLKEAWSPHVKIGHIHPLTKQIYVSGHKDANDFLQNLKVF